MNIGTKYTFWKFLMNNKITIPVIQRDYAQGRSGKEELRKRFLTNLKNALLSDEELVLDFVFGIKENGVIIPLDGQQRLTTLWLLHWYAFLKSSITGYNPLGILMNISYETRLSSRNFINELCKQKNFVELRKGGFIRETIIGKTWFMREWEQDPTVSAMLNMLGGHESIENIFKDIDMAGWKKIWKKLLMTDKEKCPILFYYLPIDGEIQQEPDDVYIKMNARGEHLTDFENFKADLIKHVSDNKEEWLKEFNTNPEFELSLLFDKDWTDVFWKELKIKQIDCKKPLPNIDKQFFAFLNRYFVNCILIDDSIKADELKPQNRIKSNAPKIRLFHSLYEEKSVSFKYKDFDIFKEANVITPEHFNAIKNIMSNLKKLDTSGIGKVPNSIGIEWPQKEEESFSFIPQYKEGSSVDTISQIHRIVFFGVCCFLEDTKPYSQNDFKEWMRYVWNIARNSNVQDIGSMKNVMKYISDTFYSMKKQNTNLFEYLSKQQRNDGAEFFQRQQYEEWKKARFYHKHLKAILAAENAFHGSIRFLLPEKDEKPELLNQKHIEKAKELIDNNLWIQKILPYLVNAFMDNTEIIFENDEKVPVKAINYSNVLVDAVQKWLKEEKDYNITEDSWVYPLLNIKGLFDYSYSKKIGIKEVVGKKGIYLYKKSYWSEDSCILLYSYDQDTQKEVLKRNDFIINCINNDFCICKDVVNLDKSKKTASEGQHYGRRIVIQKNDGTIYYCGVKNYWDDNNFIDY